MGRVEGKVALITGAARGQGRSHALRLAEEGADIVALDICADIASLGYPLATPEDLDETARLVAAAGRRVVTARVDVRDAPGLRAAVDAAVAELGRLDVVSANAGITSAAAVDDLTDEMWRDVIDVNLTGVWNTAKATLPHLARNEHGGALILTSSVAGLHGWENVPHYVAAKHGVLGIMRTLANEYASRHVRVNAVLPGNVETDLLKNDVMYRLFCPDIEDPTEDDFRPRSQAVHAMPVPWVEPVDVSNAVLFLASDEARYVTGIAMPVDAGMAGKK